MTGIESVKGRLLRDCPRPLLPADRVVRAARTVRTPTIDCSFTLPLFLDSVTTSKQTLDF